MKLRYALPLAQMILAAGLWWFDHRWQLAAIRLVAMPGPSSPAFDLLLAMSWPVAPVRMLWFWHVPYLCDAAASITLIGLFWYWVAMNIKTLRERRRVLMFKWLLLRVTSDLLLIGAAFVLGAIGASTLITGPRPYPLEMGPAWLWFVPTVAIELAWAFSLMLLFGRDLIQCAFQKETVATTPSVE